MIIDLTPLRDGAGPARLLDMVEGRSKAAFKTWLADRDDAFRDAVEVVAQNPDGVFGGKAKLLKYYGTVLGKSTP